MNALKYARAGRHFSVAITGVLLVSIVACGSAISATLAGPAQISQANQAFAEGNFAQAERGYTALLAARGYSATILFDRGNAWQKLNQPGRAILDYERALWMRPSDGGIAANLRIAQRQAGIEVTPISPLRQDLALVSFDTLAWAGSIALLTMALSVLAVRSRRFRHTAGLWGIAAGSTIVGIAAAAILVIRWPELDRAVVLSVPTPVRLAPAAAAEVSFDLAAGNLVQEGDRFDSYAKVMTSDGRSGWVNIQNIAKVVGPESD